MQSRIVRLNKEKKPKKAKRKKKSAAERTRKRRSTRTAKKVKNKTTARKRSTKRRRTASRSKATSSRRTRRKSANKWIQEAVPPSRRGKFAEWCKRNGFKGVSQRCINKAIKEGGHPAKMAQFAINVSKDKYRRPSTPKRRKNPSAKKISAARVKKLETAVKKAIGKVAKKYKVTRKELLGGDTFFVTPQSYKRNKFIGMNRDAWPESAGLVLVSEGFLGSALNYYVNDDFALDLNEEISEASTDVGFMFEQTDNVTWTFWEIPKYTGGARSIARGNPARDDVLLIDKKTGMTVGIGDPVVSFRGEPAVVVGWEAPRHEASSGRVYVQWEGQEYNEGFSDSYFPSVFNLELKSARRNPESTDFVGDNGTVIQPIQYQ